MNQIQYQSTFKACGKEYERIVFWNRFLRNPIELILSWTPAAISIIFIAMGKISAYTAVIYAACWAYPLYIFFIQFRSGIRYHLKHRSPEDDASCTFILDNSGIHVDIPSCEAQHHYTWDDYTTVYKKFGYYMFFQKGKMIVMLREADMSKEQQNAAGEFIASHLNRNECKVLF